MNVDGRRRTVERDVVQTRRTLDKQPVRHGRGMVDPDPVRIAGPPASGFEAVRQIFGERGAGEFREAADLAYVGGRHDLRDDRCRAAGRGDTITEPQIGLHVEEHLGDGVVRPGPALGHEVTDVAVPVGRTRMPLRERRDANGEIPRDRTSSTS